MFSRSRFVLLLALVPFYFAAGCGSQADKKDPAPDDKTLRVTMAITGMS